MMKYGKVFKRKQTDLTKPGPEVIKLFFMLISAKHEISNAHKYKMIKNKTFSGSDNDRIQLLAFQQL